MLELAQRFGQAGGAAGGAAGGILGGLGHLLEPLDYPRQALWNLGGSLGKAFTGEGTWEDALRAAPGALGVGAGLLAAPFGGLPLAMLAGNLAGGLGQGAAKLGGGERFDAPSVSDLTGTEDFVTNLAVGAATDPMTYMGGLGGHKLGAKAGQAVGAPIDQLSLALGPRHAGGLEKITQMAPQFAEEAAKNANVRSHLRNIMGHPEAMSEFAPDMKIIGSGRESVAFQTASNPKGPVTLARTPDDYWYKGLANEVMPRPQVPQMLQSPRAVDFPAIGKTPGLRIEHVPYADMPASFGRGREFEEMNQLLGNTTTPLLEEHGALEKSLAGQGHVLQDPHYGNVGKAFGGELQAIDPGAIMSDYGGKPLPLAPLNTGVGTAAPGWKGKIQNWLLDAMGGPEVSRRNLNRVLTNPEEYRAASQRVLGAKPYGYLTANIDNEQSLLRGL